jgi:fumarate reductase flavoprotein subunit
VNKDITRRGFIKGAAVATGAGILAGCAPKPVETETTTLVPATATPEIASTPVASGEAKIGTATVRGHGGDVTVTLTVKDGKITDCKIVGDGETPALGGKAVAQMPAEYIQAGSLEVDGVAGATVTSNAIKSAAQMAYNQAMGITTGMIKMKPGLYTAGCKGFWRIWDLPVTIKVSESAILDITVPEDRQAHGETEVILQSVKDKLFPRIIQNQSIAVDSITGATVSSDAVKLAIQDALKQALTAGGSDDSALSAFQVAPAKSDTGKTEEKSVDILLVGLSTGGICAMQSAYEQVVKYQGTKLISMLGIERAGKVGGKSALTHGGMFVNPKKLSKDLYGGADFCDAKLLRENFIKFCTVDGVCHLKEDVLDVFLKESGPTLDWLYEKGWHFGKVDLKPTKNYANGAYGVNVVTAPNLEPGSYEDRRQWLNHYYFWMLEEVKAHGAEILLETEAYELLLDNDGKVAGVKARNLATGMEYTIHAKAIIMGTGGFASNRAMIDKYLAEPWRGERKVLGTGQDTGTFLQAVIDKGAGTWNIDSGPNVMHVGLDHYINKYPFKFDEGVIDGRTGRNKVHTLNSIPLGCATTGNALAVNKVGQRFMNEKEYCTSYEEGPEKEGWPCHFSGNYYYSIVSGDVLKEIAADGFKKVYKWEGYCSQGDIPADWGAVPEVYDGLDCAVQEGMAWKADTIADLAKQLNFDPNTLEKTVADYNAVCDKGEDASFGKDPKFLTKFTSGPYYAIQVWNVVFSTIGGLDVDNKICVLKEDHVTPIKGLYAIGTDSMGVIGCNGSKSYMGLGLAQGWNRTAGKLAGTNAADYIQEEYGGFTERSYAQSNLAATSTTR